ncbi:hypothetical protein [Deferribacter abyssi]|uniref:hypothetical protein n=1 Tax=Deferribacter abyssi TaxID=213806 RepID=UPI003C218A2B
MTVRENIIDALRAKIESLNIKTGIWTTRKITEEDCPYLDIRDVSCSYDNESSNGLSFNSLSLRLTLYDVGTDVHRKLRDNVAAIYQALGEDQTLGGLADYIRLDGDEFDIEQHERLIGVAGIDITVFYKTAEFAI